MNRTEAANELLKFVFKMSDSDQYEIGEGIHEVSMAYIRTLMPRDEKGELPSKTRVAAEFFEISATFFDDDETEMIDCILDHISALHENMEPEDPADAN